LGRAEVGFDTISAIVAFLWVDTGDLIAFGDGPFGTFIDAATAIDAIFGNFVSHQNLL